MQVKSKQEILLEKYEEFINQSEFFFSYLENEENRFSNSLLKDTRNILVDHHTSFSFERKGNVREGALTYKRVTDSKRYVKVVKVRSDVEFISQIHTYFHELVHLVNNHSRQDLNDIKLTKAQREYVAEVGAQSLLYSFTGKKVTDLPENGKWKQEHYIYLWIKDAVFSDEKINEMWRQIEYATTLISQNILEKRGLKKEKVNV